MCHIERNGRNLVVVGAGGRIIPGCTIGKKRGDGGRIVSFQNSPDKVVYETEKSPADPPAMRTSKQTRHEHCQNRLIDSENSSFWQARS